MSVTFHKITGDKKRYLDLLLIGDEDETMIDLYLEKGDLYIMYNEGRTVAAAVVTGYNTTTCELKNISVYPQFQRKGYGRLFIDYLCGCYSNDYSTMILGTGDVPGILHFYAVCGFTPSHRIPDFFTDNYPHPIIEDGVMLKDMVYLTKPIYR